MQETKVNGFTFRQEEVSILKARTFVKQMFAQEYYSYLTKLKDDEDRHLLKLTINLNKDIYPIDPNEVDELNVILFK